MEPGLHILFEGESNKLVTDLQVARFLEACPTRIGMTAISLPLIVTTESGCCGYVIIAESHISVHVRGLQVLGDIFSCKTFEVEPAMELARGLLGLGKISVDRLQRGWAVVPKTPGPRYGGPIF